MTIQKIKAMLKDLLYKERSYHKLALSACVGVYIAFCPFVGLHTLMVFALSWVFGLNLTLTLATTCALNNPWTMVPVYSVGYFFGYWFLNILGLHSFYANPVWMNSINSFLAQHISFPNMSLWAFLIGGNVLGVALAVGLYPVVVQFLKRYARGITGEASQ